MKLLLDRKQFDYEVAVGTVGYNSRPEIDRVLIPFMGHVDKAICGDGKFEFYDGKDYSEDGWLDRAEDICKTAGGGTEFVGFQYAGRQVDKRQMVLDIAGKEKIDFLIMIDTDDYIHPVYQDWQTFYFQLFAMSQIVPDRVFYKWVWIPNKKLWPRQGNEFPSNTWRKSVRIHKDPGTMRYCLDSHFMWCDKSVSDQKIIKWQLKHRDEPNPYEYAPINVIDGVRDTMDRTLRTKQQKKSGNKWAWINHHAEESRKFYSIMKARGNKPPAGWNSWEEFENAPHTFDPVDGHRIELK